MMYDNLEMWNLQAIPKMQILPFAQVEKQPDGKKSLKFRLCKAKTKGKE